MSNQDFGQYELTIEQPLRENGEVVKRAGKKVPDTSKRDTEKVPLDCNVKEYFTTEILPHIDSESWIDFARTRTNYEINFTRLFFRYEQSELSASIADRILKREEKVAKMIKSLFD